ncbi:hypothetical protein IEQ34_009863 [Dendrobium chrysotoxum]|uniref:Uncharacterized protein n=1 Tax=Dendrobium chrysotoxum TaxID=161865 RepID=A0AAV7H3M6_DENCH|nr:hypothetical protein IEQ34_009863 [Dendrobium chrysotoxum]
MTLHIGLWFPLAPMLLEIFRAYRVALTKFLWKAITIMVDLTAFFRGRGARLAVDYYQRCNDWILSKRWGRLHELPNIPHLGEKEILRIINFFDTKSLQQELHHISHYV